MDNERGFSNDQIIGMIKEYETGVVVTAVDGVVTT